MDSVTQLVFGAACGEAVLGKKVGRKALVWGAVLGTLPDLDVFIPLGGPVNDFVYHRGFSHSLILLALLSPMITSPAPFTTLLWRVVGIDKDRYFETYISLFDRGTPLFIEFYPRNLALMTRIEEHPPVVKLKWSTRGYYAFSTVNEDIAMTDLRMGSEPNYVFRFKVAKLNDLHPTPIDDERLKTKQDWRRLAWVWKRIWSPIPEL